MDALQSRPRHDPTDDPGTTLSDDRAGADKRMAPRHLTASEVGTMHVGTQVDFCRIRNVSTTGLMAQVYGEVAIGDRVRIDLRTERSLEGTAVWVTEHVPDLAARVVRHVGLRFEAPIDLAPILAHSCKAPVGRVRRSARMAVKGYVRLVLDSGRQLTGLLIDISQTGAKLQAPQSIVDQSQGCLLIRGLPSLKGSVRWNDGVKLGMAFQVALTVDRLEDWIHSRREESVQREPAGLRA